jgi:Family of unknown function (DUF6283)
MIEPDPTPCEHCPWRRDTRPTLTGQHIRDLTASCGTHGNEAGLSAPMVACVLGTRERPCAGWLAAHGGDHLGVRLLVATGRLPAAALRPRPGWPATYPNLAELAQAHTGMSLGEIADCDLEPDLDVHDPATGRARLMQDLCSTCILRPGDLMHLGPEGLRRFLAQARDRESFVICHQTLPGMSEPPMPPAICRGFFNHYDTAALRIAATRGFDEITTPAPPAADPAARVDPA